jgi:2-polyprenyl-3-methyl-5-hydroxy-6-metoxy-1,4-benzoquinol methylase
MLEQKLQSFECEFSSKTENINSCPSCNSKNLRTWIKGYDRLYRLSKQKFIYSQCNQCKLIFLSLRPLEREIGNFYPDNYAPYTGNYFKKNFSEDFYSHKVQKLLKKVTKKVLHESLKSVNSISDSIYSDSLNSKLKDFYQPTKSGLKLLDFGCGSALFLNYAQKLGWDTMGLDFSELTVQKVIDSGHKAFLMSPKAWDEIENESLDFVRMSHVLEHLYHPKEILEAIRLKMKPGATLHIIVPNPQGISAKIFRSRWLGLDCPRHIMLYSPFVLKELLFKVGLSHKQQIVPETLTNDFVRSFGFVLHDLGLIEHNAVHEIMHDRYLADIFNIPMKIASALNIPDRFHIFVNK